MRSIRDHGYRVALNHWEYGECEPWLILNLLVSLQLSFLDTVDTLQTTASVECVSLTDLSSCIVGAAKHHNWKTYQHSCSDVVPMSSMTVHFQFVSVPLSLCVRYICAWFSWKCEIEMKNALQYSFNVDQNTCELCVFKMNGKIEAWKTEREEILACALSNMKIKSRDVWHWNESFGGIRQIIHLFKIPRFEMKITKNYAGSPSERLYFGGMNTQFECRQFN